MKPALIVGMVVACIAVAAIGGYLLTRPSPTTGGAVTLSSPTGTTSNSATLTWSQSADNDFASYAVYQSTSSGTLGSQVTTITAKATTSYSVTGLSPGTTYYFTVRVNRAGGAYGDSNQVSATTSGAPGGELPQIEMVQVTITARSGELSIWGSHMDAHWDAVRQRE